MSSIDSRTTHEKPPLIYTKITIDDADAFIALEGKVAGTNIYSPSLTKEEFLDEIRNGTAYFIKRGSDIVGSIAYQKKDSDKVYISGLVVDPQVQGQGIAREALIYILGEIGTSKRIYLVTHPDNAKALNLYQSLGFTIESRKEDYYGDGEPRLVLILQHMNKD